MLCGCEKYISLPRRGEDGVVVLCARRHPGAGEPEGPQGQASQMGMKRGMMIKRGTAGLYGVR